jgi:hypothetical protein
MNFKETPLFEENSRYKRGNWKKTPKIFTFTPEKTE